MSSDHRNRRRTVCLCVNKHVICPFHTSESHEEAWGLLRQACESERVAIVCCAGAGDAITANLLTGLLCRELPAETALLHMLSGGRAESSRCVTVPICAYCVCCFGLWGQIMFGMMTFLLASARLLWAFAQKTEATLTAPHAVTPPAD